MSFTSNLNLKNGVTVEKSITMNNPNEIIFLAEEAPEGGYTARALGESIFTEVDDLASLHRQVRDAVHCHFDAGLLPKKIRLLQHGQEVIVE